MRRGPLFGRTWLMVAAVLAIGAAGPAGCGKTTTTKTSDTPTTPSPAPLPAVNLVADPGGPYEAIAGRAVTFSGLDSTTPNPPITSYRWDFGDGSEMVDAPTPSHVYVNEIFLDTYRSFAVTLTISDSAGKSATATTSCRVSYHY